ncbi:hypothetical protein OV079_40500 [Nannocystis pusilla]|uniref:Teneurin-like YD-shell domain-containing protein n=1 Tax=Nannocystis pusilla TaxID=889268 RepID=A0A9X3EYD9_9BACT|nr:RHS repeat-associated core domain-containing protein [Nannocystis pusilla]MCY1011730.1 hypothetical protein [Nannocystis pusilla]
MVSASASRTTRSAAAPASPFKNIRRTRWLWDGDVPLHEWTLSPDLPELPTRAPTNPADERPLDISIRSPSADDPELLTWIFEPATFTPVARLSSHAREAVSLVADHLGTPIAAFDTEGRPVWSVAFDIHGRVRDLAGDRQLCPFRYPGQYEDTETGLYYNRFRYYDPEAGQYISQDPLGLAAGLAFYAYVPDPLSSFDPLGLHRCDKKTRQTRPLDHLDIEHAWSRHAGELLGGAMQGHVHRSAFVSILDRARRSGLTFFSHSASSATIAHLARIDGKYIVVHFFRDGPHTGKVASAWWPSQRQLGTYLRQARRDGP